MKKTFLLFFFIFFCNFSLVYSDQKVAPSKCNIFINKMIDEFILIKPNSRVAFTSLGQLRYLSAIQFMHGVVGNSSSGLIEVPSFKVGTVNIGDRQKGRVRGRSIIDCEPSTKDISIALKKLFSQSFRNSLKDVTNPYGEGDTSKKIVKILSKKSLHNIIKKKFYNI